MDEEFTDNWPAILAILVAMIIPCWIVGVLILAATGIIRV